MIHYFVLLILVIPDHRMSDHKTVHEHRTYYLRMNIPLFVQRQMPNNPSTTILLFYFVKFDCFSLCACTALCERLCRLTLNGQIGSRYVFDERADSHTENTQTNTNTHHDSHMTIAPNRLCVQILFRTPTSRAD